MNDIYTRTIHIQTTDTDLYNNIRPNALLQYFQDVATEHAVMINMSRDYLVGKYHACWILARIWYRLSRPIHAGDTVELSTWHRGASGIIFYRDFELVMDGEVIGEGVSAWVVADVESRRMLRPASIDSIAEAQVSEKARDMQLKLIREAKDKEPVYDRTVRYSDLDVNGHMNNTRYADVILDALTPEELEGRFISQFQLNYSQECMLGDTLTVNRKMDSEQCYVDGCGEDGKRRFEANIQFADLSGKE